MRSAEERSRLRAERFASCGEAKWREAACKRRSQARFWRDSLRRRRSCFYGKQSAPDGEGADAMQRWHMSGRGRRSQLAQSAFRLVENVAGLRSPKVRSRI